MSAEEMSRATLKVVFDGPDIHNGTMDVRDLAPALLAIGRLCEEANRVLNGDRVQASVLVRANFQKGSFEVNLDLVQSLLSQMKSFLSGDDATAAANLLTFLTTGGAVISGGGVGLFKLIKLLKGRRPGRVVILEDGNVRLETDEGDVIQTKREVVELYRDLDVRKAASDAVRPLEKNGIDVIKFSSEGRVYETISKEEATSFLAPILDEEKIISEERNCAFTIMSISFKDGNKWKLHDGQNTINASIEDQEFIRKVNEHEIVFAKHDMLICRVLMQQWRTASGLRTEYTVLEVLEHRSAVRQLSFPFDTKNQKPDD